jgi:hypothetical protein
MEPAMRSSHQRQFPDAQMGTNQIEKPVPSRLILNSQPFAEPSIMYSLKNQWWLPHCYYHILPTFLFLGGLIQLVVFIIVSHASQITPMKPTLRRWMQCLLKNKPWKSLLKQTRNRRRYQEAAVGVWL